MHRKYSQFSKACHIVFALCYLCKAVTRTRLTSLSMAVHLPQLKSFKSYFSTTVQIGLLLHFLHCFSSRQNLVPRQHDSLYINLHCLYRDMFQRFITAQIFFCVATLLFFTVKFYTMATKFTVLGVECQISGALI